MKFTAKLNTPARIITTILLLLPIALPLLKPEAIWASVFLLVVFFVCYGYAPRYYELTTTELKIKLLFKDVTIPLTEIKHADVLPDAKKLRWRTLRIFGSGGVFGYFGKYWNTGLGSMTWYLKNFDNVLIIETKSGKRILISPDAPEMLSILMGKLRS